MSLCCFSATSGCHVSILTWVSYVARVSRFSDPTTACTCLEIPWSGGVVLLPCQRSSSLRSALPSSANIARHRCLRFGVGGLTQLFVPFLFFVCVKAVAVHCTVVMCVCCVLSRHGLLLVCNVGALMALHVKCHRHILQVKWQQFVYHEESSVTIDLPFVLNFISCLRNAVFIHIARLTERHVNLVLGRRQQFDLQCVQKETKMFFVIKLGRFWWHFVHRFLNKFAAKSCKCFRKLLFTNCSNFFGVFEPPFGGLGATYDDHLRLIGKCLVDFLLVLIELFSLGVMAEALRVNIGSKSAVSLQRGPVDVKFQVEGMAPPPTILLWKLS